MLSTGFVPPALKSSYKVVPAEIVKEPPVGALGSGSDYTAFLDHVGIASLDMGLNGKGGDGTYHCIDVGRSCTTPRGGGPGGGGFSIPGLNTTTRFWYNLARIDRDGRVLQEKLGR